MTIVSETSNRLYFDDNLDILRHRGSQGWQNTLFKPDSCPPAFYGDANGGY